MLYIKKALSGVYRESRLQKIYIKPHSNRLLLSCSFNMSRTSLQTSSLSLSISDVMRRSVDEIERGGGGGGGCSRKCCCGVFPIPRAKLTGRVVLVVYASLTLGLLASCLIILSVASAPSSAPRARQATVALQVDQALQDSERSRQQQQQQQPQHQQCTEFFFTKLKNFPHRFSVRGGEIRVASPGAFADEISAYPAANSSGSTSESPPPSSAESINNDLSASPEYTN